MLLLLFSQQLNIELRDGRGTERFIFSSCCSCCRYFQPYYRFVPSRLNRSTSLLL